MIVYVATKNTGPTWGSDPLHMIYMGVSLEDAIAAATVNDFERHERELPHPNDHCTVLPRDMEKTYVKYYMADGWWRSIVSVDLKDEKD